MSVLEWKNFNLFKLMSIGDKTKFKKIKTEIVSQCYNDEIQVYCDANGWIHVFLHNWDCQSFQAEHQPIKLCAVTNGKRGILITALQDNMSNDMYIKIFNVKTISKKNGAILLGSARLTSILSSATVINTAFIGAQLCIAIGFRRGDIHIFKGTINRDISTNFRIISVSTRAINGIAFRQIDNVKLCMFVCSNAGIFSFTINDANVINETKTVLDSCIENTHCYDIRADGPDDAYFTVGREKAIYCYTNDGRGPCYILDGEKISINWLGNILIVVMKQNIISPVPVPPTKLIMVDIKNKIIVLNREIDSFEKVVIQQKVCYVFTKTKQIFALRERNTQSKIRLLLKKNLFDVALIQITDGDERSISEVHLQYGDYLFQRGELQEATEMYIKTIGVIEPFTVISKLLDSRYVKYLIQYLENLVKTGIASKNYMELLLYCKERINLPTRLEKEFWKGDTDVNYLQMSDVLNSSSGKSLKSLTNKKQCNAYFEKKNEYEIFEFIVENKSSVDSSSILEILKNLIIIGKFSNIERFVALLIPQTDDCIEFLEYLITYSAEYSDKTLLYLFEFYLQTWKHKEIPNDQKILDFLKKYECRLCTEAVIILCRIYCFWHGIIYFEKNYDNSFSALYITQNNKVSSVLELSEEWEKLSTNIWVQTLHKSKTEYKVSSNYANFLLYVMITKKPTSLLQILQCIASNKNIYIQHIKDCLSNDLLENIEGSTKPYEALIKKLQLTLTNKQIVLNNFHSNPIEFRNSICDKCRQELSLPAIYFLCQHAFHKDCLGFYSENNLCTLCTLNLETIDYKSDSEDKGFQFVTFDDAIFAVSKYLENGILYMDNQNPSASELSKIGESNDIQRIENSHTIRSSQWAGRLNIKQPDIKAVVKNFATSQKSVVTNPFEDECNNPFDEYDDNLNPFNTD